MMIKTILNNNAVIAIDENEKEVVIVKNGIGLTAKGDGAEGQRYGESIYPPGKECFR